MAKTSLFCRVCLFDVFCPSDSLDSTTVSDSVNIHAKIAAERECRHQMLRELRGNSHREANLVNENSAALNPPSIGLSAPSPSVVTRDLHVVTIGIWGSAFAEKAGKAKNLAIVTRTCKHTSLNSIL